jgi:hypothetical protein
MIFTARQLEQLHRSNGHVTLPYAARLTPLAKDWLRTRKIAVGYSDVQNDVGIRPERSVDARPKAPLLWWTDGPCGPAKAALLGAAREAAIEAIEIGVDPRRLAEAVRILARQTKDSRISGGVLLVENGAAAMVYANRCRSLRAVLGTCLGAVEHGLNCVAANVLVIEHPHQTMPQVRNMLGRFLRSRREVSDEINRQLEELASCE